MRIIIIGALAESLLNFRGELIRSWCSQGHEVVAIAAATSLETAKAIEQLGCRFISFPLSRTGLNPLKDLYSAFYLWRLLRQLQPSKVFAYTLKPVVWGGLAARLARVPDFYALISGLGFSRSGETLRQRFVLLVLRSLLRLALKESPRVIFQNDDDRRVLLDLGIVKSSQASKVNGSGVDLEQFSMQPLPADAPIFLVMARLIVEKGHREFVAAAKLVKLRYPNARFQILGQYNEVANAISRRELDSWQREGLVEYLGETGNVLPYMQACSVFVLPSYYGEGLPRSILEAMAIGRPVITTDNVGCRDTVEVNKNGLLVPIKDSQALADAMLWMLEHQELWPAMGRYSRHLAEEKFDVHAVNRDICQLMDLV